MQKRITPRGRILVRTVAAKSFESAAGNPDAALMLFRHDPRFKGYSSIWMDLAIAIAIQFFKWWVERQILTPSVTKLEDEPTF
jgi:hypothetical protein